MEERPHQIQEVSSKIVPEVMMEIKHLVKEGVPKAELARVLVRACLRPGDATPYTLGLRPRGRVPPQPERFVWSSSA